VIAAAGPFPGTARTVPAGAKQLRPVSKASSRSTELAFQLS
jgi:hypothetical protein